MENLTPRQIVAELDRYVVGQHQAKRAVAVALRNRYRRRQLQPDISREITPKNILLIGPTGVGKTEIARRVAALIDAPFVKVEATKFTEVGYVGRDVESIVQDLVEMAVRMVHDEKLKEVHEQAEAAAFKRIVEYIYKQQKPTRRVKVKAPAQVVSSAVAGGGISLSVAPGPDGSKDEPTLQVGGRPAGRRDQQRIAELLRNHLLDDEMVEIEVSGHASDAFDSVVEFSAGMSAEEMAETFNEFIDNFQNLPRRRARKVSVKEARRILTREEANKLIDVEQVIDSSVHRAEEMGVVFIDELDKICGPAVDVGADISGEGVQRDLLPIVDGSTVMTRYGPIKTDHVLFIAAGAFYHNKPSDLIPELQGRFPLRVELQSLGPEDFQRILTEPRNALVHQYQLLLGTEGIDLVVTDAAIRELARLAALMNERMENIGARRLHTIMEKVLEDLSFSAAEMAGQRVVVDEAFVTERLAGFVQNEDLSKYIL